ncbi:ABC transporter ATP-binding protein [Radicibacter daui]|uniref:ABC transporter ATP-binding protein n=1 Tax=Radicibacter daui TaxID=3064829 RepID=UPI004046B6E1
MSDLRLHQLGKDYGSRAALEGISLTVGSGEFVAVLGPSGCGKTTLLRLIAGFETADRGEISLGERRVSGPGLHVAPEKRGVGIVFQNYALWPHMSVAENIGYSLKVSGTPATERAQLCESALELVGLSGFGARAPAELSGGQRQRVALARCLVARPSVLLLDEPLANLDVHLRAAMEAEFHRLHRTTGATMLYITHDQAEAMALATRVAVMEGGHLMQFAPPRTLYREPASEMVARFIGKGQLLPVEAISPLASASTSTMADLTVLGVPHRLRAPAGSARAGGAVSFHPADLVPAAPDEAGFAARITTLTYRGSHLEAEVRPEAAPDTPLTLHLPDGAGHEAGAALRLRLADGWILPPAGAATRAEAA